MLAQRMRRCSEIYYRFVSCLPARWPATTVAHYTISKEVSIKVELLSQSRYTWLLSLRYRAKSCEFKYEIRLYLDAHLAETVAFGGRPVMIGTTWHPHARGCRLDEKQQMDNLLLECLRLIDGKK